jgi:hypothetical protein
MGHPHRVVGSLVLGSVVSFSGINWADQAPRPAVTLLVFDNASVPRDTVSRARETVMRIFREANIDVAWVDPVKDRRFSMINPTTNETGTFIVQVMIRPHRALRPGSVRAERESVMGTALESGQNGGVASVFYDQVVRTAHHYHHSAEALLALAITHEMGHVLLPSPAHSSTGIMRADWGGDDIRHAVLGSLTFTPLQADLIRAKVAAWCRARPRSGAKQEQ